ncbi:MAG: hypothetical protein LAT53_04510 [Idiomarina sp.]|nr:hypothetical protein [Idiomarina sp.]
MTEKIIYHVSTQATSRGSRVSYQMSLYKDSRIIIIPNRFSFNHELFRVLFSPNSTVVFHQQAMLPQLLLSVILQRFKCFKANLVYDIHDIHNLGFDWKNIRKLTSFFTKLFEPLIIRRVKVITVSRTLKRSLFSRYGVTARVVYNMGCDGLYSIRNNNKSDRCCYFGLISPNRICIDELRTIQRLGIAIDLYGVFSSKVSTKWKSLILELIGSNGGEFKGPYSPDDMEFLLNYSFSYMAFPSTSINIMGSMPNKLFQSLSYGLTCLVYPHQKETVDEFESTGYIIELSKFSEQNSGFRNCKGLEEKLELFSTKSKRNFLSMLDTVDNKY